MKMQLDIDIQHRLRDFELDVQCRTGRGITGLFGPSGAGKTTLLKAIAGIERPKSGRITFNGDTLFCGASKTFVPAHKRCVSVVFQDIRLFPHLSVLGNLRFALRGVPKKQRKIDIKTVVGILELSKLLDRPVNTLSGGQAQRAAIARAVISSPRLLLLDEPISALDAAHRYKILPFLRTIQEKMDLSVIFVSHNLDEILYVTDRLIYIREGKVVCSGKYYELIRNRRLDNLFDTGQITNLLPLRIVEHKPDVKVSILEPLFSLGAYNNGKQIKGPLSESPPGGAVTATIRPDQIALATAPVEQISIQNQLAGVVKAVNRIEDRVIVCVDIGMDLFVDITGVAAEELEINNGKKIWCLFKTLSMGYTISQCPEKTVDDEMSLGKLNEPFKEKKDLNESSLPSACIV